MYGSDISDDDLDIGKETGKPSSTKSSLSFQPKSKKSKFTASDLKRLESRFEESVDQLGKDHHSSDACKTKLPASAIDTKQTKKEEHKTDKHHHTTSHQKSKKSEIEAEATTRHHSGSLQGRSAMSVIKKEDLKFDDYHYPGGLGNMRQPTLKIEKIKVKVEEGDHFDYSINIHKSHKSKHSAPIETERVKKESADECFVPSRSKQSHFSSSDNKRPGRDDHHYSSDFKQLETKKEKEEDFLLTEKEHVKGPLQCDSSFERIVTTLDEKKHHRSGKKRDSLSEGHLSKKKERKRSKSPSSSHRHHKKKKHQSRYHGGSSGEDQSFDDKKKRNSIGSSSGGKRYRN